MLRDDARDDASDETAIYPRARREVRQEVRGDVLWAYAVSKDSGQVFRGLVMDESPSGLGIVTTRPIREGEIVKVYHLDAPRSICYARARWCSEIAPATYRCGFSVDAAEGE